MLGRRVRVACTLCHHFTTRRPNVLCTSPRVFILLGQSRQQSTMFHRAVAKHQSEQPLQPKPAVPFYAPKSSSQQKDIQSAFRSSQTQHSGFLWGGVQFGALKNSRPQVPNVNQITAAKPKLPSSPTSDATNSQLFSSERGTQLLKTLSNDTAFQENSPPLEVPSASSSIMNSLHEAVYFDENDFDDDIDLSLDFDVDEPLIPQDLKAAVGYVPPSTNPMLPKPTPTTQVRDVPDSSAPLPWSSSPARHVQPMAASTRATGKVLSQGTMNAASIRSISSTTSFASARQVQQKSVSKEKPKRRLPWLYQSEEVHDEEPEAKRPRGRKPREPRQTREAPETPHKRPSMPWDATASAAKVVRQEFKVKTTAQKRSISSKAVGAVLERVVKKQKEERIHSIFLSEEQQRVIDLVLNSHNSVFFTGSAGLYSIHTYSAFKYASSTDKL
ncbi:hypothetical protein EV426DRAFT_60768 [Tirmania nivea]|nr:hypothetical protein EV426DRAFT_60768 [Tirmania nivea]